MFATAAEMCEWIDAPYLIENPVSTISTYWRGHDHTFSPEYFTRLWPQTTQKRRACGRGGDL